MANHRQCSCTLRLLPDGTCRAGCHLVREERRLAREERKRRRAEARAEQSKLVNGTAIERTFRRVFGDRIEHEKRAGLIPTNRSQRGKR